MIAASAVALMAPAAQAAKVKIGGTSVSVSSGRVASIGLTNPNRSAAKGTVALKWQGTSVGRKSFLIPARASRKVKVKLISDAYDLLSENGKLKVSVAVTTKGKGTSKKNLTLKSPSGGTIGEQEPGGGGTLPGGGPAAPAWVDGRYQGTYAENNTNMAFNVVGNRLFTGPFDGVYIEAACEWVQPLPRTDSTAIEPVEATIGPDGTFSGSGTYVAGSGSNPIPWTISGRIVGKRVTNGIFSVDYTSAWGPRHCSGSTHFTADWYGDYTL